MRIGKFTIKSIFRLGNYHQGSNMAAVLCTVDSISIYSKKGSANCISSAN